MLDNNPFFGFLYTVFFLFVIGMLLFIPFPYHLLPNIGTYLSNYTISFLSIVWNEKNLSLASDEKGMILCGITWFLISCIVSFFLLLSKRVAQIRAFTEPYFEVFVTYYLAMQLFSYGFDKVFKHQFYLPEPNILYTHLGDLNKDILYWSTMGSSYSFSFFGGIMEIIPAILLLFRKTRVLGASISFAVFIQIVMINIGFEITVKCLSSFLLLLSFYLLSPHLPSFYRFFIKTENAQIIQNQLFIIENKKIVHYLFLKYSLIFLILMESLSPFLLNNHYNDDKMLRPPYHGAYQVLSFWQNGDTISCENPQKWKRIFFHRQGYFIIQNNQDKMQDFEYELDTSKNSLFLRNKTDSIIGKFDINIHNEGYFEFSGRIFQDSIQMKTQKIVLSNLPIFQ